MLTWRALALVPLALTSCSRGKPPQDAGNQSKDDEPYRPRQDVTPPAGDTTEALAGGYGSSSDGGIDARLPAGVLKLQGEPKEKFWAAVADYSTVCVDASGVMWAGKGVEDPRKVCALVLIQALQHGETDGVGPFETVRSVLVLVYKKTAERALSRLEWAAKPHGTAAPSVADVAAFLDAAHRDTGALPTQALGALKKKLSGS
jgi:hypothetical protein